MHSTQVAACMKKNRRQHRMNEEKRKKNELHEAKTENFMYNFYSCFIFANGAHRAYFAGPFLHTILVSFSVLLSRISYNSLYLRWVFFIAAVCFMVFDSFTLSFSLVVVNLCMDLDHGFGSALNSINLIMCAM